jgi:hypothetical protein
MTRKEKSILGAVENITSTIMELDDIQEINKELRRILKGVYEDGYREAEIRYQKIQNSWFREGRLR